MIESFSHLRIASEYSISHGLITIDQIVDQAAKNNMPSVALTDHLNMFGLVKFFLKAEKKVLNQFQAHQYEFYLMVMILLMNYCVLQKIIMAIKI